MEILLLLEYHWSVCILLCPDIIPLTYIMMTLMAFYGPNAEILGNIKLAVWHYQTPIEDIETFISNVGLLLVIDFLRFIINGTLL